MRWIIFILSFIPIVFAFDFYIFAQTWAPTFCIMHPDKCSNTSFNRFIIHGLWPQYKNRTYPQYCSPCERFDRELLDDNLKDDLERYWSDTGVIDWYFLEHEWEKHGCCSGMGQDEYFMNALNLRKNWDFKRVFESIGIFPNRTVVLSTMRSAARDFCGNRCYIAFDCINNKLMNMYMSLSKNMGEIIQKIGDSCDDEFLCKKLI